MFLDAGEESRELRAVCLKELVDSGARGRLAFFRRVVDRDEVQHVFGGVGKFGAWVSQGRKIGHHRLGGLGGWVVG